MNIDKLVAYHTAFSDMEDMTNARGSYRPSINCVHNKNKKERAELEVIADRYDMIMGARGDERRAYRY